jgi:hypothetical protein
LKRQWSGTIAHTAHISGVLQPKDGVIAIMDFMQWGMVCIIGAPEYNGKEIRSGRSETGVTLLIDNTD